MEQLGFGEKRIFQPGDLIVREGSPLRDLYILSCGVLEMSVDRAGKTLVVGEMKAPEILGELSFLEGLPWPTIITAKTEVEVFIMRYEKIQDIRDGKIPRWFQCLLQVLVDRSAPGSSIKMLTERIASFQGGESQQPKSLPPMRIENMDVLVVEDDIFNLDLAKKILEKHGHNAKGAMNGLEALEMLSINDFDLVLMDLQMPEMGGIETARLIRACESPVVDKFPEPRELLSRLHLKIAGNHLPIIAMTANNRQGEAERCLEAGMDSFIAKPFRLQKALAALQTVLREKMDIVL